MRGISFDTQVGNASQDVHSLASPRHADYGLHSSHALPLILSQGGLQEEMSQGVSKAFHLKIFSIHTRKVSPFENLCINLNFKTYQVTIKFATKSAT